MGLELENINTEVPCLNICANSADWDDSIERGLTLSDSTVVHFGFNHFDGCIFQMEKNLHFSDPMVISLNRMHIIREVSVETENL